MKKIFNKIVLIYFAMIFVSCASTGNINNDFSKNVPQWVYSSKSVYPEKEYLTYVGYGADRNTAEIAALSGISAIFGQDVIVKTNASNRMTEAAAEGKVVLSQNRDFNQDIVTKVNVDNLVGVEIAEYWPDKNGTWYAIAVLNRDKACSIYSSMISKNAEAINELILSTKSDIYSLQSLCAYDFAQEIAVENKKNLDRVYVINYDFAEKLKHDIVTPEEIGKLKFEIAKKIPINIYINGDDKDTYTSVFRDALSDYGFSSSENNKVRYIIGGKVTYHYENTTDGKTSKCYYDLESALIDTENQVSIFPINIRGRQAHRTEAEARNRVKLEIIEKIKSTFNEEFDNYLGSYQ